jgi:hypothetical protein
LVMLGTWELIVGGSRLQAGRKTPHTAHKGGSRELSHVLMFNK